MLRGLEGPRVNTRSGAHNMDCGGESGDMHPRDFAYSEVCSGGF